MPEETHPEPNTGEAKSPSPNPNAGEAAASSVASDIPTRDEAQATDMPSANAPAPEGLDPEVNPNAVGAKPTQEASPAQKGAQAINPEAATETEPELAPDAKPAAKAPTAKAPVDKKPAAQAAKAKKEKAPAVEDKPFTEFVEQDYLPALKTAFAKEGVEGIEVAFVKDKIQIPGLNQGEECWQVVGKWLNGQRQFNVYFPDEDINKLKAFSWSTNGAKLSTLESFMIDERKVTLDLLVFYTVQRLNAQKWLAWN